MVLLLLDDLLSDALTCRIVQLNIGGKNMPEATLLAVKHIVYYFLLLTNVAALA
jgi:hypothetical protein